MTMHSLPLNTSITAARCERCRRPLTDPKSIQLGMGPECRGRSGKMGSDDLCRRDEFSDLFDHAIPFEQTLVMRRLRSVEGKSGTVLTNIPHLVVHHSPDGYEFGYGGSGPADLALNICQLYLNMTSYEGRVMSCYDGKCWALAFALHQQLKEDIIAAVPTTGVMIPYSTIEAWFQEHITDELRRVHAIEKEG